MSKERTSLSLEPQVAEYLRQDRINASGLVNDLVKRHMNGGATDEALREFRKSQIQSELKALEEQQKQKKRELEKLDELDEQKQEELEDAIEVLSNTPRDPDNPAVQTQADKLNMKPEELIAELPDNDDTDLDSL